MAKRWAARAILVAGFAAAAITASLGSHPTRQPQQIQFGSEYCIVDSKRDSCGATNQRIDYCIVDSQGRAWFVTTDRQGNPVLKPCPEAPPFIAPSN